MTMMLTLETNASFNPFGKDASRPHLVVLHDESRWTGKRSIRVLSRHETREKARAAHDRFSRRLKLSDFRSV